MRVGWRAGDGALLVKAAWAHRSPVACRVGRRARPAVWTQSKSGARIPILPYPSSKALTPKGRRRPRSHLPISLEIS